MFAFVRRIEAAVERCGHGGANARCALAGGVAVHLGGGLLHHIENCSLNRFGCRNAGVADAEVEDVILADFGLACLAVCEQLANRRRFAAQLVHALIDHGALVSPRAPTGGVAGFLHASMIKRKGRESWGMEPFFCRWKRRQGGTPQGDALFRASVDDAKLVGGSCASLCVLPAQVTPSSSSSYG